MTLASKTSLSWTGSQPFEGHKTDAGFLLNLHEPSWQWLIPVLPRIGWVRERRCRRRRRCYWVGWRGVEARGRWHTPMPLVCVHPCRRREGGGRGWGHGGGQFLYIAHTPLTVLLLGGPSPASLHSAVHLTIKHIGGAILQSIGCMGRPRPHPHPTPCLPPPRQKALE